MNSSDEPRLPTTGERDAARARLARQIGRLLAHEWLRNRAHPGSETSAASTLRREESPHFLSAPRTKAGSGSTDPARDRPTKSE
jgi:hypothetical protein